MNPRSDVPSSGGQLAPLPTHTHELTQTEILELGVLAVEEPHEDAAEVAPMGIPATSPLPPTTIVAPQLATPVAEVPAPASQPAQPVMKRGVLQPLSTTSQQAVPSENATAPQPEPPVAGAPKTTPSKAPDVARPAQPTPLAVQQPETATQQPKPPLQLSSSEPMELSANSMNLKSISRLRTLGIAMNILVIILIIGILAGGWYVYTYVLAA